MSVAIVAAPRRPSAPSDNRPNATAPVMPPMLSAARNGSVGRCIWVSSVGYQYVIRVIHEQERAHQDRCVHSGPHQIWMEEPDERQRVALLVCAKVALSLDPHRALVNALHDEQHEERRQDPDPEHHAPAHVGARVTHQRIAELEDERRRAGTPSSSRSASGPMPCRAGVPARLQRQRHACRHTPPIPIPNSARSTNNIPYDVEKPPRNERRSSTRGWRTSADPCGPSDRQPCPRRCRRRRGRLSVIVPSAPASALSHREAALNVDEEKRQDGEVEAVEHPSHVGADERLPLSRRDPRDTTRQSVGGMPRRDWRGPPSEIISSNRVIGYWVIDWKIDWKIDRSTGQSITRLPDYPITPITQLRFLPQMPMKIRRRYIAPRIAPHRTT